MLRPELGTSERFYLSTFAGLRVVLNEVFLNPCLVGVPGGFKAYFACWLLRSGWLKGLFIFGLWNELPPIESWGSLLNYSGYLLRLDWIPIGPSCLWFSLWCFDRVLKLEICLLAMPRAISLCSLWSASSMGFGARFFYSSMSAFSWLWLSSRQSLEVEFPSISSSKSRTSLYR